MIKVITQPSGRGFIGELADNDRANETLLVVESAAQASFISHNVRDVSRATTFEDLSRAGLLWYKDRSRSVSRDTWRVMVRQEIEKRGTRYSALIGASAGKPSNGVLREVCAALARVERNPEEPLEGERGRQLMALHTAMQAELDSAGLVLEESAILQAWQDLGADTWWRVYPGITEVVLLGLERFDHLHILILQALERIELRVAVYLNFDPEVQLGQYPHLETALSALEEVFPEECRGSDNYAAISGTVSAKPVVLKIESRREEGACIAAIIDRLREQGSAKCAVATPEAGRVKNLLRQACREYGLSFSAEQRLRVLDRPEWSLFQLLAQLGGDGINDSLPRVLAHPYLPACMPEVCPTVLRRASQVVSEALAGYGKVTRLGDIIRYVEDLYQRAVRAGNAHPSEDTNVSSWEKDLTSSLTVLRHLKSTMDDLARKRSFADWYQWLSIRCHEITMLFGSEGADKIFVEIEKQASSLVRFSARGEAVHFGVFVSYLRTALYGRHVEFLPDNDADVQLLSMESAPYSSVDVLFLAGIYDGQFPKLPIERAAISGGEPRGIEVEMHVGRQRLLFDHLVKAAPRVLIIEAQRDGENLLLSSQFVEELSAAGDSAVASYHDLVTAMNLRPAGKVVAQEQLLADRLRRKEIDLSAIEIICGDNLFTRNVVWNTSANSLRHSPQPGPFDGFIDDPILLRWLDSEGLRRVFSVSQFDSLVNCPYRFFLERLVKVADIEEPDILVSSQEMGVIVHEILRTFHEMWYEEMGETTLARDPERARQLAANAAKAIVAQTALPEFARRLVTGRMMGIESELDDVSHSLPGLIHAYVDCEINRTSAGGSDVLAPAFMELGFGHEGGMPITFGSQRVLVRGTIDRVDTDDSSFCIIDYKTGSVGLPKLVAEGYLVQLPVYALVAAHLLIKMRPEVRNCLGGIYYFVSPMKADAQGQMMRKKWKGVAPFRGNGMDDDTFEEVLELVSRMVGEGVSKFRQGVFHLTTRNEATACKYCAYERVCRKDLDRVARFFSDGAGSL